MISKSSFRLCALLCSLAAILVVSGLFVGMSVYGKESATTPHRILSFEELTKLDRWRFEKIVPGMVEAVIITGRVTNLSTEEVLGPGDVLEDGYYQPNGNQVVELSFNPGESTLKPGEFWIDSVWSVKLYPQSLDSKTLLSVGNVPDTDMPLVWFEEFPPGPPSLGMNEEDLQTVKDTMRSPPQDVLRGEVWWEIGHIDGFSLDSRSEHCVRTKPGEEDSIGPFTNSKLVENTPKPKVNLAHKGEKF